MRFALVLSLLALLVSFVSAQSLCFGRPSFLSSSCGEECKLRGHSAGGTWNDGQCCCSDAAKRSVDDDRQSAEQFFGGKLLVADDNSLQVHKDHGVSRISCNACDVGPLGAGGLCCEASCKSTGKNAGQCENGVCVCSD